MRPDRRRATPKSATAKTAAPVKPPAPATTSRRQCDHTSVCRGVSTISATKRSRRPPAEAPALRPRASRCAAYPARPVAHVPKPRRPHLGCRGVLLQLRACIPRHSRMRAGRPGTSSAALVGAAAGGRGGFRPRTSCAWGPATARPRPISPTRGGASATIPVTRRLEPLVLRARPLVYGAPAARAGRCARSSRTATGGAVAERPGR